MPDKHDKHWEHYTGIQAGKHELLRKYLGAWLPILTYNHGRVLYVESHAGRGKYKHGEPGSPLVALKSLLSHPMRDPILARCVVQFVFMEDDPENAAELEQNILDIGPLPNNVEARVVKERFESALDLLLGDKSSPADVPPSFFFVDPFNYELTMPLLRRILARPKSELLLTFMYRFIDLAIMSDTGPERLDALFGSADWRTARDIGDSDERHNAVLRLFTQELGAKYCSSLQARGLNGAIKYDLVHLTNHELGRVKMKDAMWSVTPDGSFSIHEGDNPAQLTLIRLNPDLGPLCKELMADFGGRTEPYSALTTWLLQTIWKAAHLRAAVVRLCAEGCVSLPDGQSGVIVKSNPRLQFSAAKGADG